MRRMAVIGAVLFALLAGVGFAAVPVAPVASGVDHTTPEAMVKRTGDELLARLRKDHAQLKAHPDRIYGLVSDLLLPHFDFTTMSRWVLGRYWRTATPAQRKQFVNEFRTVLVRTYATALLEYRNQRIRYLPFHGDVASGDVTVRTVVLQPGGRGIPIDYRLDRRDGRWMIYDVSVDGVSLVMTYRGSFASEIRRIGMDGLLNKLRRRNRQLSQAR
ncbi:putative phospholipid-binding protein MlaC precursor [bacterium BMS3Bbin12]|nr:putative phospholipid-binding protein MlaC precursor [bacterium BMS3Abin12]GBE48494.1 putative phospholipid-binding protein MlaC precursor [bacterium BMS3Bbin12]GBE51481.1 putative phospholipid-binding protein MlaC precursor [bacterium BMS3Bbin13]HDJ86462.1 ABC transporter substrate-binding protein [Chromatiales bacterium]HDK03598.1 ABC transporter substrate-binding protein [Gammaproteobacteria bacterium]